MLAAGMVRALVVGLRIAGVVAGSSDSIEGLASNGDVDAYRWAGVSLSLCLHVDAPLFKSIQHAVTTAGAAQ
jgi:hypothetical protein